VHGDGTWDHRICAAAAACGERAGTGRTSTNRPASRNLSQNHLSCKFTQFAVESIRRWWNTMGASTYPDANRLLITVDSGGSNGSRLRL